MSRLEISNSSISTQSGALDLTIHLIKKISASIKPSLVLLLHLSVTSKNQKWDSLNKTKGLEADFWNTVKSAFQTEIKFLIIKLPK